MIVRDPEGWLWEVDRLKYGIILRRPGSFRWVSQPELDRLEPVPGMEDLYWKGKRLVSRG